MRPSTAPVADGRSGRRLFVLYAVASFVPIVVLGICLSWLLQVQADNNGLNEAREQAGLAAVVFRPLLTTSDLGRGLSDRQRVSMQRTVRQAADEQRVLRVTVYTLDGRVVFSSDGGQLTDVGRLPTRPPRVDDEMLAAATGEVES